MNIVVAVSVVVVPTVVFLGIIAGKSIKVDGGAVFVDVPLGTVLLFSSLAAVVAPLIFRNKPRR